MSQLLNDLDIPHNRALFIWLRPVFILILYSKFLKLVKLSLISVEMSAEGCQTYFRCCSVKMRLVRESFSALTHEAECFLT